MPESIELDAGACRRQRRRRRFIAKHRIVVAFVRCIFSPCVRSRAIVARLIVIRFKIAARGHWVAKQMWTMIVIREDRRQRRRQLRVAIIVPRLCVCKMRRFHVSFFYPVSAANAQVFRMHSMSCAARVKSSKKRPTRTGKTLQTDAICAAVVLRGSPDCSIGCRA